LVDTVRNSRFDTGGGIFERQAFRAPVANNYKFSMIFHEYYR
jgi:hypothetical protein